MKLNLEFNVDELESYAIKVLTKVAFKLLDTQDPAVAGAYSAIQQGLMSIVMAGQRPQSQGVARGYPYGPPVGYTGPGPWPYGPPPGPPPGPFGGPPQGNVRPIREPGAMEHCIPIDESRLMEAGWACCGCGTFNGVQRDVCRQCKHPCCVPIAPPSPSPTPEPS